MPRGQWNSGLKDRATRTRITKTRIQNIYSGEIASDKGFFDAQCAQGRRIAIRIKEKPDYLVSASEDLERGLFGQEFRFRHLLPTFVEILISDDVCSCLD